MGETAEATRKIAKKTRVHLFENKACSDRSFVIGSIAAADTVVVAVAGADADAVAAAVRPLELYSLG